MFEKIAGNDWYVLNINSTQIKYVSAQESIPTDFFVYLGCAQPAIQGSLREPWMAGWGAQTLIPTIFSTLLRIQGAQKLVPTIFSTNKVVRKRGQKNPFSFQTTTIIKYKNFPPPPKTQALWGACKLDWLLVWGVEITEVVFPFGSPFTPFSIEGKGGHLRA